MAEEKKHKNSGGKAPGPEVKGRGQETAERKQFKKNKRPRKQESRDDEFEQKIIDLARVTRVMAGGKRMRFRACVAIGDKKGRVGFGLAKGADVTLAVSKAVAQAKKRVITVPMVADTIPHEIYCKYGAAKLLFKPAKKGRGVIAGGAVRTLLELAGVKNATSKILGTNNKVNNVACAMKALASLSAPKQPKGKDDKAKEGPQAGKGTDDAGGSEALKPGEHK